MNEFARCHPLVNFFYFAFVIGFSMFFMHPICLAISLSAGAVYAVLRFVPRLSAELKEVRAAQKCIGRDVTDGRFLQKMKNGMRIFSVMLSRSLENAPITADSMKSRGFGLAHRTAYTCFVFDARDAKMLTVVLCAAAYVLAGSLRGALTFTYFPTVSGFVCNAYTISLMLAYAVLCFLPIGFELREVIRWKKLQSKM